MHDPTTRGHTAAPQTIANTPAPARRRVEGLDLARFLALVGMMATHLWTVHADGSPGLVSEAVSGKAAALFAVLAGVGIALTSRSLSASAGRWNLLGRGAALVVIGMTLGLGVSGIIVILVSYGVIFWASIPLLRWSNRGLLIGASLLAIVWPFVSAWLRAGVEQPFEPGSANWLSLLEPASFLRGLLLTGMYPLGTWIVYAMVGMVVGRLVLDAVRTGAVQRLGARLVAVGAALATLAWGSSALLAGPLGALATLGSLRRDLDASTLYGLYYGTGMGAAPSGSVWWLTSPAPHSGTTFDLAITIGIALAVIGTCLVLGMRLPPLAVRVLEPVRRAGSAPLTVYAAHVVAASVPTLVLVLALGSAPLPAAVPWFVSSGALWALHVVGAVVIGAILVRVEGPGPLERLVRWSGRTAVRRAERRSGRRAERRRAREVA